MLPKALAYALKDVKLAETVYGDPFTFANEHPIGTPARDAVVEAYKYTQRLLCITGICISVLLVAFSFVLRNPHLGKEQSLKDVESSDDESK